jgi:hypothetical protein
MFFHPVVQRLGHARAVGWPLKEGVVGGKWCGRIYVCPCCQSWPSSYPLVEPVSTIGSWRRCWHPLLWKEEVGHQFGIQDLWDEYGIDIIPNRYQPSWSTIGRHGGLGQALDLSIHRVDGMNLREFIGTTPMVRRRVTLQSTRLKFGYLNPYKQPSCTAWQMSNGVPNCST